MEQGCLARASLSYSPARRGRSLRDASTANLYTDQPRKVGNRCDNVARVRYRAISGRVRLFLCWFIQDDRPRASRNAVARLFALCPPIRAKNRNASGLDNEILPPVSTCLLLSLPSSSVRRLRTRGEPGANCPPRFVHSSSTIGSPGFFLLRSQ